MTAPTLALPMRASALNRQPALDERWAAVEQPSFPTKADDLIFKLMVDPEHNARSGSAALAWGSGMWKAMLG